MSWSKCLLTGIVASLGFIAVVAGPAGAKPPPPPPPVPKIVGIVPGGPYLRAVASDGTVYQLNFLYPASSVCAETLTTSVVLGHLFPGIPSSPIAATTTVSTGLQVALENGDIWKFVDGGGNPCDFKGVYMGNVFTLAGIGSSASASEVAPQDAASATSVIPNAVGSASPNPAHGTVSISYSTAKPGRSLVRVFDASGRLVRTLQTDRDTPGTHSMSWDGRNEQGSQAASGAYFYQVQYPDGSVGSKSLVLMR